MLASEREAGDNVLRKILIFVSCILFLPTVIAAIGALAILLGVALLYSIGVLIMSFILWLVVNNRTYWNTVKRFYIPVLGIFKKSLVKEEQDNEEKRGRFIRLLDRTEKMKHVKKTD